MNKEQFITLLLTETDKAVNYIDENTVSRDKIDKAIQEFDDSNRDIRDSQVGRIQKDKIVGKGEDKRVVKAVRIPLAFQNYIVDFSTAFEVGEPVTVSGDENNNVSEALTDLWNENRLDALIYDLVEERKSKYQSAILFYIRDISTGRSFVKSSGINPKKDIKAKVLRNKDGVMTPIFDSSMDMIAFSWQFTTKDEKGKDKTTIWLYDNQNVFEIEKGKAGFEIVDTKVHGFDCIPVVYTSQENTEYQRVLPLIDRYEVALSKLGASNDYAGHPILKLYGTVEGAPDKDEDGKAFRLEQKETDDGKIISSDVDFLTYDNAPASVELELNTALKLIFMFTSSVDLSLDQLSGLGNTSGFAIQLMFLAPIIKAKTNNTKLNSPMISRMINVMLSGIVTTLNTAMKNEAEKTSFSITFNSILPSDLKERITSLALAVEKRIMSQETAVRDLGYTDNHIEELTKINGNEEPAGE